jgi:hypothetical protein
MKHVQPERESFQRRWAYVRRLRNVIERAWFDSAGEALAAMAADVERFGLEHEAVRPLRVENGRGETEREAEAKPKEAAKSRK